MGEYEEDEIERFEWLDEEDEPCACRYRIDNDQGRCMACGHWINYGDEA